MIRTFALGDEPLIRGAVMAAEPLACPYCNAFVRVPADLVAGQRLPCPRCGEVFPYRPRAENGSTVGQPVQATAVYPSAAGLLTARRRRPNWLIAVSVLGLMAVMAGVGLFWSLKTVPDRRGRDRKEPVGYLPSDCDLVLGVHVTKLLEASAGRDLTRELDQTLAAAHLPPFQHWTGLRWDEVDQAFLGVRLTDRLLPRLIMVVQTRDTYDAEKLRAALKVSRSVERGQKTLYRFQPGEAAFELELWCPSETILVVGLAADNDLDAVPLTPYSGVAHLPAWMQALLLDPTGKNAQAWVLAHSDDWKKALDKSLLLLLARLPERDKARLTTVQTLALWLRFDEDIRSTMALKCSSIDGARGLREQLIKDDVVAPANIDIKREQWVEIQTQLGARALIQRFKDGLGR